MFMPQLNRGWRSILSSEANKMKRLLTLIFALMLLAPTARAGLYEDAMAAIEREDYPTAIGILKTIAEQGNPGAQATLALVYDMGHGVAQDSAEAVKWYRLAAAQGEKSALYNLAGMYDAGQGVAQDNVRAYMWYDLSVTAGNASAAADRDELAKKMSKQQIAEAKKMEADCLQKKPKLCD
jgi:TPR repeat protein